MPVVECGCTQSRRGSRQDWPEYCLFILAWFPPIPSFVTSAPDWPREVHYAAGSGAFCIPLTLPAAAKHAKLPGAIAKADAQHSYPSLAPWLAATSAPS
jgi:hypothetical protein